MVWLSASIRPQLAVGGCAPSPTKLSPASARIPSENWIVPCTISRLVRLGSICWIEMRAAPLPLTRAESTKSSVHSGSAPARTSRAKTGMLKMPMATMALTAEGPTMAVIMIAISSAGKAKIRSLKRITTSSSRLPRVAAASSPSGTPPSMPIPTASKATAIDVRAPTMIIDRISRPKWSVPSRWSTEDGANLAAMFRLVTSCGVHSSDTNPAATNSPLSPSPISSRALTMASSGAGRSRRRPARPRN